LLRRSLRSHFCAKRAQIKPPLLWALRVRVIRSMDKSIKCAYRHLGLTGYAAIQSISSSLKVGTVNLGTAGHVNASLKLIASLSEWFGTLMSANVSDFREFSEEEFWARHQSICKAYPGYNLEVYKDLFEDSVNHARGNS
ncbi:hypothetical protein ACNKU7_18765, partial [Microbulbifer sp. SA54]|uniref:hypothetical protein n=1 Tax=Microbulbifer sp. SA54 TaxID=3401577 RepID=UPI003AADC28B